jgi:hypothetical protein
MYSVWNALFTTSLSENLDASPDAEFINPHALNHHGVDEVYKAKIMVNFLNDQDK